MKTGIHTYRVEGMTCDHCKASVENGILNLDGITGVMVDRANSLVTVQAAELTDIQIRETIEKLGYRYTGKV